MTPHYEWDGGNFRQCLTRSILQLDHCLAERRFSGLCCTILFRHLDRLFQKFTPQSHNERKWWCKRELWNTLPSGIRWTLDIGYIEPWLWLHMLPAWFILRLTQCNPVMPHGAKVLSTWVQMITCHLISTKPLPEPILVHNIICVVKFEWNFDSRNIYENAVCKWRPCGEMLDIYTWSSYGRWWFGLNLWQGCPYWYYR